jgi:hypothetical protein
MTSYERDQYVTSIMDDPELQERQFQLILRSVRKRTKVQERQSGIAEERQGAKFP